MWNCQALNGNETVSCQMRACPQDTGEQLLCLFPRSNPQTRDDSNHRLGNTSQTLPAGRAFYMHLHWVITRFEMGGSYQFHFTDRETETER